MALERPGTLGLSVDDEGGEVRLARLVTGSNDAVQDWSCPAGDAAFVALAAGHEPTAETAKAIFVHSRQYLAPHKRIRRIVKMGVGQLGPAGITCLQMACS